MIHMCTRYLAHTQSGRNGHSKHPNEAHIFLKRGSQRSPHHGRQGRGLSWPRYQGQRRSGERSVICWTLASAGSRQVRRGTTRRGCVDLRSQCTVAKDQSTHPCANISRRLHHNILKRPISISDESLTNLCCWHDGTMPCKSRYPQLSYKSKETIQYRYWTAKRTTCHLGLCAKWR